MIVAIFNAYLFLANKKHYGDMAFLDTCTGADLTTQALYLTPVKTLQYFWAGTGTASKATYTSAR
ncbi:hypothetical protein CK934_07035 [Chitinophaga sp. MD30]|nr:hypothetical protein CK934_07035 [Chitinophaga sp. MD30]